MSSPPNAPGAHPDGLPAPRRYWALVSVCAATVMSVMDNSIANVALPSIAHDLHVGATAAIWVVNSYQIVVIVCLLPMAALGEIVGYRKICLIGQAVFVLGSLGCALSAHSLLLLSLARAFQGVGAAGISSISLALVRFIFPRAMLGRAVGLNAMIIGLAAAVSPAVTAGILSIASWPWLFGVNVPIGVAAAAIGAYALPQTARASRKLDWISAGLNVVAFGPLMVGAQTLAQGGAEGLALAEMLTGVVAGVFLVRREVGQTAPLVPFDLLRVRLFTLTVATAVGCFVAQGLAFVALPFHFIRLGFSPVQTGLLMSPWPASFFIAAPLAGRLADRYPPGPLAAGGLSLLGVGLLLLAVTPTHAAMIDIVWRMVLCGLGFGLFQSPNNRAMMSNAPAARSGAASGVLGVSRQFGLSLGGVAAACWFRLAPGHATTVELELAAVAAFAAAGISLLRAVGPPKLAEV